MRWERIKLGEVIKHRKGSIIIDDTADYKLCRVQLHRRGVVLREIIKGDQIKTKKQQVCRAGDFLVAEMDAKLGGYGFVPDELDGAIVSSHYFLFELDYSKIRPGFLEVISQLQILQDQIKAVGSTNYAAIRPANVLNWEIPITDIQGQIQIEALYRESRANADQISSELTYQLTLLKQLRQAFLREAMQGKLVPQDPRDEPAAQLLARIKAEKEELIRAKKIKKEKDLPKIEVAEVPFEVPEGWVWCRLGEIADIKRGIGPKYSEDGVPFMLNQKCVRWFIVDITHCKNIDKSWYKGLGALYKVDKNDLLINSTGDGTIGRSAIADHNCIDHVFDSHILRVRSFAGISQSILCFIINSEYGQGLINVIKGATSTKQTELGVNNLSNFPIPLPPLAEQHRIVAKLDELMRYCDDLEASILASQGQNEGLLQQVLREALEPGQTPGQTH